MRWFGGCGNWQGTAAGHRAVEPKQQPRHDNAMIDQTNSLDDLRAVTVPDQVRFRKTRLNQTPPDYAGAGIFEYIASYLPGAGGLGPAITNDGTNTYIPTTTALLIGFKSLLLGGSSVQKGFSVDYLQHQVTPT